MHIHHAWCAIRERAIHKLENLENMEQIGELMNNILFRQVKF